ncbi:DUF4181 domain-containing protein [Salipaludibacillus daqingensis]|nr:DUF4181 domain-containing protein [Salipaludibacillus daqingensis]
MEWIFRKDSQTYLLSAVSCALFIIGLFVYGLFFH